MRRKITVVATVLVLMILSSVPGWSGGLNLQSPNNPVTHSYKQIELFAGYGYFNPGLKKLNDGIDALHDGLVNTYYVSSSSSANTIGGLPYIDFGIRYFINTNLSISLSVGHYEADESNQYSGNYIEDFDKPLCTIHKIEDLTYSHEIRINPTLLSLTYEPPVLQNMKALDMYIGGGVGYYFSSLKNELDMGMDDEYTYRTATIDTVVSLNLLANHQANSNPLGFHLLGGININVGRFLFSLEGSYHFAKAEYEESDWIYFTQKHQQQLPSSSQYSYKCYENKIFQIDESRLEDTKVKELDFSGFIIKGRIGLSF